MADQSFNPMQKIWEMLQNNTPKDEMMSSIANELQQNGFNIDVGNFENTDAGQMIGSFIDQYYENPDQYSKDDIVNSKEDGGVGIREEFTETAEQDAIEFTEASKKDINQEVNNTLKDGLESGKPRDEIIGDVASTLQKNGVDVDMENFDKTTAAQEIGEYVDNYNASDPDTQMETIANLEDGSDKIGDKVAKEAEKNEPAIIEQPTKSPKKEMNPQEINDIVHDGLQQGKSKDEIMVNVADKLEKNGMNIDVNNFDKTQTGKELGQYIDKYNESNPSEQKKMISDLGKGKSGLGKNILETAKKESEQNKGKKIEKAGLIPSAKKIFGAIKKKAQEMQKSGKELAEKGTKITILGPDMKKPDIGKKIKEGINRLPLRKNLKPDLIQDVATKEVTQQPDKTLWRNPAIFDHGKEGKEIDLKELSGGKVSRDEMLKSKTEKTVSKNKEQSIEGLMGKATSKQKDLQKDIGKVLDRENKSKGGPELA